MATLLLRCVAPLQAWGTQSRFSMRDTEREPSKSGVIGLLCAAVGRPRGDTEFIQQLAALRMGVRVDQEGYILRDYHTAMDIAKASGAGLKSNEPSTRYYLADAAFLVGLEGELSLLTELHAALNKPKWMLFLGRKACPPAAPVYLANGLLPDTPLRTALTGYAWIGGRRSAWEQQEVVRLVMEDAVGHQERNDTPIDFSLGDRRFGVRRISAEFIPKPSYAGHWLDHSFVNMEITT